MKEDMDLQQMDYQQQYLVSRNQQMKEGRQRQISLQPISSSTQLQLALLSSSQQQPQPQPEPTRQLLYKNQQVTFTNPLSPMLGPVPNLIKNQKYTLLSFVPHVLYDQFKYFFNLFYLFTAISQFIPVLKVGLAFAFVAPLVLVLFLTMLKQGYEDYQRFLKDKEINQLEFTVWYQGNKIVKKSSQLKVGDMVQVASGTSAPADCLLLHSFGGKGSIFIKTDQLDGQTDWKLRKAILPTDSLPPTFFLKFQHPQINIYKFLGSCQINSEQAFGLNLQNTIWRGVKIATGKALLLVIYTGKQTKLSLNMKESDTKFGKLDEELNFFSKILFLFMCALSFMLILMRGFIGTPGENFILFFKYFLLLSSIIPISMRVNLDFAKLFYKFMIDRDENMTTPLCRNSNIPEQLGRIQYILSDKTGTLTQNQMIFRKLYLSQNCKYESDDTTTLSKILSSDLRPYTNLLPWTAALQKKRRTHQQQTVDSILALMICHNVTPVLEDDGTRVLQGSSPDQLTLVKFAEQLGFVLKSRSQQKMEISSKNGENYQFQVLVLFPFTSQSKRMAIVVRETGSGKIILYLKGADTVIQPKISSIDSDFMIQACSDLARQGLRTLVITQKLLTPQFYEQWKKSYNQANSELKDRDQKINKCRLALQSNMNFLAVTGVEDKLQDKVVETVGSARSIGIKVWMLTGDKVQTAICVGRAVKLIQSQKEKLFVIQGINTEQQFRDKLRQFYQYVGLYNQSQLQQTPKIACVLVIDGTSLKHALQSPSQFFNIAIKLPAIICSRVSPTQKAQVATLVIKYSKSAGRVLGIGDGGNDVALIQSAHVGVGIYGKEGIQAALASDFSIGQFKDLEWLMYWHGRLSYKRSSLLAQFIIHRGVIITIMQIIFIIQFYFVPLPIFNGALMLGYSTIFTMLPVFALILDQDITRKICQKYPILYKTTQQGTQVSPQSFIYWMIISIYQGAIIMILISVMLPNQSFYMVTTVSFTCLIAIQFLNVFTEINRIHYLQVISTLISAVIYICSIFLMKNVLNGVELFTTACLPITMFIVLCAWGPPFLYEVCKRCMYPTEEQKIMKQAHGEDSKDL